MPDHDTSERTQADAILGALEASNPATIADLATALETHPVTVERSCRSLQRAGHIRQCTGGVYTLVETETDTDRQTTPADAPADRHRQPNPAD
ncbi:Lrp/AsnC family transcriptional regulator [Natronorubrum sp. DTA28]|uniref:Lrp/AsnC family transcriptional regulator n=1 Tax=Natronorubrum sp. DTA28 TaxID=3447019 RepID=UPI003F83F2BE